MDKYADMIVFGNVITMDEHKPFAEAVAVKGDRILYVGAADVAKKLCNENTKIYDYGTNSVYPGFLEGHSHPGGTGWKMCLLEVLDPKASLEQCVEKMKAYMEKHPDKEMYQGMGFELHGVEPHRSMLDAICPDKVMMLTENAAHQMWLNTKALEKFGIDKKAAEKWGTSCVKVDENGEPTGFILEGPVFEIRAKTTYTVEDFKEAVLYWQDYSLARGYTGVYSAGAQVTNAIEPFAYYALEKEGKLLQYTTTSTLINDNTDTPEEDMDKVAKDAKEHNSKHYKLIGAKVFCDGVIEGKTGWMLDEYVGMPGFYGVSRFNDHDKMVRLVKAASKHNMNVHVHTIGDAAVRAWVDAIAEAEEETGNFDMRNGLAHLQSVKPEDIKRIADYNIIAVVGLMWVEKTYTLYKLMVDHVGKEKGDAGFPIKAFLDAGAVIVSHTDYPASTALSAPWAICLGTIGYLPSNGEEMCRHPDQNISRMETMKALTTNVAYSWHEEANMGSLEVGKLANIAVFDKDFLKDDLAEVEKSKCLATFVDGKQVYKA
ncbi:MAG: amidohydrolase [Sphaerochaetaceae bacterium]|nr:amidohydrolase [Sphaerochaetaceae bacterium]